jgi:hypothetical protein
VKHQLIQAACSLSSLCTRITLASNPYKLQPDWTSGLRWNETENMRSFFFPFLHVPSPPNLPHPFTLFTFPGAFRALLHPRIPASAFRLFSSILYATSALHFISIYVFTYRSTVGGDSLFSRPCRTNWIRYIYFRSTVCFVLFIYSKKDAL